MIDLQSLPVFTLALPVLLVVGAWILSKLLRFSFVATVLMGLIPVGLPFAPLPLSAEVLQLQPEYVILGGWLLLVAGALGWVFARPVVLASGSALGLVRVIYLALLGSALLAVAVLLSRRDLLQEHIPGWREGAGVILLCASLLGMSISLARTFRAALMFSVWAGVSIVLASEIFLNKLPQEVVREDLRAFQSLVPPRVIDGALERLHAVSKPQPGERSDGRAKVRAVVLGGSSAAGYPFAGQRSLAKRIERGFRDGGAEVEVRDLGVADATVFDIRAIVDTLVAPSQPDLAVVVGWGADSELGVNSFNLPGLTEREALAHVKGVERLKSIPFAEDILTSSLYRFVRGERSSAQAPLDEKLRARVPVEEYEQELGAAVRALRAAGTQVVLIAEPTMRDNERPYQDAMRRVAEREAGLFVAAAELFEQGDDPRLFGRGELLSDRGYDLLTEVTVKSVRGYAAQLGEAHRLHQVAWRSDTSSLSSASLTGAQARMVVRPADVTGDLVFKLRMPEQGTRFYTVSLSINGTFVADRRLDSRESTRVRFQLPQEYRGLPIVELALRTTASPPLEEDRIGTSATYLPVPLAVQVSPAHETSIRVGEWALYSVAPFSMVALDARSGSVISTIRGTEAQSVVAWSRNLPWGTVVVGALSAEQQGAELPLPGARGLAAGPVSDVEGRHTAFVRVIGGTKGEAIVRSGDQGVTLEVGSGVVRAYNRFVLEEVAVNDQPLALLAV